MPSIRSAVFPSRGQRGRGRWSAAAAAVWVVLLAGCSGPGPVADGPAQPVAELAVELECGSGNPFREGGTIDYAVDAVGVSSDPVRVVEQYFGGEVAGDRLTLVGTDLPGGNRAVVAVERDGSVVALIYLVDAPGGGGLLVGGFELCSGELRVP